MLKSGYAVNYTKFVLVRNTWYRGTHSILLLYLLLLLYCCTAGYFFFSMRGTHQQPHHRCTKVTRTISKAVHVCMYVCVEVRGGCCEAQHGEDVCPVCLRCAHKIRPPKSGWFTPGTSSTRNDAKISSDTPIQKPRNGCPQIVPIWPLSSNG